MDPIATTAARNPLRVWPGMVLGTLFLLVRSGLPLIGPDFTIYGGPRGTPTLSQGRVYSLGATGILSVLDPGNGALVWSHDAGTDTGAKKSGVGHLAFPRRRLGSVDCSGALDLDGTGGLFQRLRCSQRTCLRLRRRHHIVHRSEEWRPQMEGRTVW